MPIHSKRSMKCSTRIKMPRNEKRPHALKSLMAHQPDSIRISRSPTKLSRGFSQRRKIEDDGAEYFGAFLTKTADANLDRFCQSRFFVCGAATFRSTVIFRCRVPSIITSLSPPCVESLCDRDNYLAMVDIVRLFLANRRSEFR